MPSPSTRWVKEQELEAKSCRKSIRPLNKSAFKEELQAQNFEQERKAFKQAIEERKAERRAKEERKALEHLTQAELGHLTLLRVVADQKQEIDNLRLALKQEREKSGSASRPNGEGNDLIQSLEDSKPSVDPRRKERFRATIRHGFYRYEERIRATIQPGRERGNHGSGAIKPNRRAAVWGEKQPLDRK